MSELLQYKFEVTNECTCLEYDRDENTTTPDECFGTCWEWQVEDFTNITEELFNSNETNWWKVDNLRLWNGEVSGYFQAKTPEEVLRGMVVNSSWNMRGIAYADRVEYSLSHHDAPMGSVSVLRSVTEEQREELGLY